MFDAIRISLDEGQSYAPVQIAELDDYGWIGLPEIFEQWTSIFFADNKCVMCHHWNINVIHLFHEQRTSRNTIPLERVILSGDIIYHDVSLIPSQDWITMPDIPDFFTRREGALGQFVFSCGDGTFITHDWNVASVVIADPRRKGITAATQVKSQKIEKASAIKTMNRKVLGGGKISRV